jgi:hypothetical protein
MDPILVTNGIGPAGAGLTNDGEMVVLFYWDGASDRVADVDLAIAGGAPGSTNTIAAKSAVDGPDGDTATTAYLTDALTIGDLASDTSATNSLK